MNGHAYPVRVDASLDPGLSRWLWLVKWLLAIPHYIVLFFLWIAFFVLSVVAWVAILVTGSYPRGIFDFNVGVLRWSWRVAYYTYGGLGTDHYPPFRLAEDPDFPAHLEVEYPDHLSRGLALVKWWLLAIPHYLVVGVFAGTGWYVATNPDTETPLAWSGGLIGLLVFVAGVVLLFTGRYPRSIFDLVLGLNRWVLRVAAYASLMTDDYPPFRLDQGGTDPGTAVLTVPPRSGAFPDGPPAAGPPPATPPPNPPPDPAPDPAPDPPPGTPPGAPPEAPPGQHPTRPATRWGAGRVLAVVLGSVLGLGALGLLVGGLALRLGDDGLRDGDGYLMSSTREFSSPGYAAVTEDVDLGGGASVADFPERWLGTVKVTADARTDDGVFVGIARTSDAMGYLQGVAHSRVEDPLSDDSTPATSFSQGGPPPMAPQLADFWVASARGDGTQTLTWHAQEGSWTLVVMNGSGRIPVAADVAVGATVPILGDIATAMMIAGAVALVLAILVLYLALRRVNSSPAPTT